MRSRHGRAPWPSPAHRRRDSRNDDARQPRRRCREDDERRYDTRTSTAWFPSPPFRAEREGPGAERWEGEVGFVGERSGIPHLTPTLSAPEGGEGIRHRAG